MDSSRQNLKMKIARENLKSIIGNIEATAGLCDRLMHARTGILKDRDQLMHARADLLKDRVVAKSVCSGLRVDPSAPRDPCPMAWTNAQAIKTIKTIKTAAYSATSPAYSPTSPAYSLQQTEGASHVESPHTWLLSPAVSQPVSSVSSVSPNGWLEADEWGRPAAVTLQRAWRLRAASRRDDAANAVFLRSLANGNFVNKWQRVAASIVIQNIIRGSSSRKRTTIARGRDACARILQMAVREYRFKMLQAKRAVQTPAAVALQCVWRGCAAKGVAWKLKKKHKKSKNQLEIAKRAKRKRAFDQGPISARRKKKRAAAQAKCRRVKRKLKETLNARAVKRIRERYDQLIEHVRDCGDDHILETFESEVLNDKGIFDFDSDSESDDE